MGEGEMRTDGGRRYEDGWGREMRTNEERRYVAGWGKEI